MKIYLHIKLEKQTTQIEEVRSSFEFYLAKELEQYRENVFTLEESLLKRNIIDLFFKKVSGQHKQDLSYDKRLSLLRN